MITWICRFPDRVRSLTLLAPAGLMDLGALNILRSSGIIQAMVKPIIRSNQENAWRRDFHSHTNESLVLENKMVENMKLMYQNNPFAFRAFWKSAMQFPLSGIASEVTSVAQNPTLPILLLVARNDQAVKMKPSYDRWLAILNENRPTTSVFQTKIYENAGHGFFIEQHELVNADVLSFLLSIE